MARFTKPQLVKQIELLEAQNIALTAAVKQLKYCQQLPPHLHIYVNSVAQQNQRIAYDLESLRKQQADPENLS